MAPDEASVTKTWFRRSLERIIPVGGGSTRTPSGKLREIFADLITYVLLFQANCTEKDLPVADVRHRIVALIGDQERRAKAGDVSWEAYREALFAVLSWVDEIILMSAWPHRGQWRHLMLTTFGTLNAGEQFFTRLDALPTESREVREIYYLCLSLGFQGENAIEEKPGELRELRRGVYRRLGRTEEELPPVQRLFPEAYRRPTAAPIRPLRRAHQIGLVAALLLPLVLFGVYTVLLRRDVDAVLAKIQLPPPPLPPTPTPKPKPKLVEVLRSRGLRAEVIRRGIVITLPNVLFDVNSSTLSSEGERKIRDVAGVLAEYVPREFIVVEGHASREAKTAESLNKRLSEDRARTVMDTLIQARWPKDRIDYVGYGSRRPAVTDRPDDPSNRRVEIVLEGVRD